MRSIILVLSLLIYSSVQSQKTQEAIDILQYDLTIHVSDTSDVIVVQETVHLEFSKDCNQFYLNLDSKDIKGMTISDLGIQEDGKPVQYRHIEDTLFIRPNQGKKEHKVAYHFEYSGIPENGLIIGENKFGSRTFFGDNWPNRAHYWFACVDHPSEKATVNFDVYAPSHYSCIATGLLKKVEKLPNHETHTSYISNRPLPTKVMVIGLADFSITEVSHDHNFDLSSWSYLEDAEKGANDMAVAADILDFFIENIGDYPFEKLANVQSTTMFGGMENAGNIFYDENAITGNNTMIALIAHEIAHQWFGNSASESDWKHLWLSEGFATYFTDLYFEHSFGVASMNSRLIDERKRVISFSKKYDHPVIDSTYQNLMVLLNPNSYQKGAWFLHMLRQKVSSEVFWSGTRKYYDQFKYKNANTQDFMKIISEESNMDLTPFFEQWLYNPGHPIIESSLKRKHFKIKQVQPTSAMTFDLEALVTFSDGSNELRTFSIDESKKCFRIETKKKITGVKLDPNVKLLFEEH